MTSKNIKSNQSGFNKDGYNKEGYDKNGYDKNGIDKDGYFLSMKWTNGVGSKITIVKTKHHLFDHLDK